MIIIDFKFTGLDNSFIKDNEIISMKLLDTTTQHTQEYFFKHKKPIGATAASMLSVKEIKNNNGFFCEKTFEKFIKRLSLKSKPVFYGFGVNKNIEMLAKYGIHIPIIDIQERMRLTEKHEYRMAVEGHSLEACYYMVTGVPKMIEHYGIYELYHILVIHNSISKLRKKNKYLIYMPWGHCAGMTIKDYCNKYRRAADGYRFNNNDLLSESISYWIDVIEDSENDEEDENKLNY